MRRATSKKASSRGRASGSLSAAAVISASVRAATRCQSVREGCLRSSARESRVVVSSGFFFIIANPFASVGMSGGNDAECLAAHGEGDVQGKAVDLSRLVIASLAVVLASVFAHEG